MNAMCDLPGHEEFELIAVCFGPSCSNQRIACIGCIQDFHCDHPDDVQSIDDIKNCQGNFKLLSNTDIISAMEKIQKRLNSNTQFQREYFNDVLNNFEGVAQMKLLEQKQTLQARLKTILEPKQQLIDQFNLNYAKYNDLSQVNSICEKFLNNESSLQEVNQEIMAFLKNDQRRILRQQLVSLQQDLSYSIPEISKDDVDFIAEDIEILSRSMTNFITPHYKNSFDLPQIQGEQFKMSPDQRTAHFDGADQMTFLTSLSTISYPQSKTWVMRFSKISSVHQQQQLIVGYTICHIKSVILDKYKSIQANIYKQGCAIFCSLVNGSRSSYMTMIPQSKFLINSIRSFGEKVGYLDLFITMNMKEEIFRIECKQDPFVAEITLESLKQQNAQLNIYQQLFNKRSKLRLFVSASNITVDVSLQ